MARIYAKGPDCFLWKGGRTHHVSGYITLYVPGIGHKAEHVLIAEKAIGHPLPVLAQVHHVDGVRWHNENTNLVVCENAAYYKLLHCRQKLVAIGADPNTEKLCDDCRVPRPLHCFGFNKDITGGRDRLCRECKKIRNARRFKR